MVFPHSTRVCQHHILLLLYVLYLVRRSGALLPSCHIPRRCRQARIHRSILRNFRSILNCFLQLHRQSAVPYRRCRLCRLKYYSPIFSSLAVSKGTMMLCPKCRRFCLLLVRGCLSEPPVGAYGCVRADLREVRIRKERHCRVRNRHIGHRHKDGGCCVRLQCVL